MSAKYLPLDRIQGCLMGVAIGDALGMPVETMTHDEIAALNSGTGVIDFIAPVQRRIRDTINLKPGDTTDDWQLTRALARSVIRTRGLIDVSDCAREHVAELESSTFGWGGTTQKAIEAIRRGQRNPLKDPLPPAPEGKGCGNGIIMKIAPLVLSRITSRSEYLDDVDVDLWKQCRLLGLLTHPDLRATISAYAVALLMGDIVYNRELVESDASVTEEIFLPSLVRATKRVEAYESITTNLVSERLSRLNRNSLRSAQTLRETVGCGCHALDTVAFTIGTFLRHSDNFFAGVLEAVNAGGDTDTNASIVGALIGLNRGLGEIPKEWRNFNPKFEEALVLGEQIAAL